MKEKVARFFFVVLVFVVLLAAILLLYYVYQMIFQDANIFESTPLYAALGVLFVGAFLLQKLQAIAYPNSTKSNQTSNGSTPNPSSIPQVSESPSPFIAQGPTPTNPSSSNGKTPIQPNSPTKKTLAKPQLIGVIIVIIIIVVIIGGRIIVPRNDPIEGIWVNEEMIGWGDCDYVYLDIFEFETVYGYGRLSINCVPVDDPEYIYGSGLWYRESDGYRLEIREFGSETEIFNVYIVGNELYLSQTQMSWGYVKTEE